MAVKQIESSKEQTSKSPYQLDLSQTTKACQVLLEHIADEKARRAAKTEKPNLLSDDADGDSEAGDEGQGDETPIWMIVTTKKHIVDKKRLKPHKIPLPNPIHASSKATICLITADPQRLYKDAIADSSFPAELRQRLTRVIGLEKLRQRYKSYESRRQLFAEHDIFLADSRVITYLPKTLGKIFYKGGSKRPIPVELAGPRERDADGKRVKLPPGATRKSTKDSDGLGAAEPAAVAKEVEKALGSALVHLATSASTAVKVGRAGLTPSQCTQNIKAVVDGMTDKLITQGWRNVRAIHIKGPNTVAFPVWLASELWTDEADVLEQKKVQGKKRSEAGGEAKPAVEEATSETGTAKRKADELDRTDAAKHAQRKKRKAESDARLAAEVAARKQKLKAQKANVMAEVGGAAA